MTAEDFAGHAGGEGAFIGREPYARQFAREVEAFHQFAGEDDGAVEHAQDDRYAVEVLEITVDAFRHVVNGFFYALIGNVGDKVFVLQQYSVHHKGFSFNMRKYAIFLT